MDRHNSPNQLVSSPFRFPEKPWTRLKSVKDFAPNPNWGGAYDAPKTPSCFELGPSVTRFPLLSLVSLANPANFLYMDENERT